jgi:hypothetical protein
MITRRDTIGLKAGGSLQTGEKTQGWSSSKKMYEIRDMFQRKIFLVLSSAAVESGKVYLSALCFSIYVLCYLNTSWTLICLLCISNSTVA